MRRCLTKGLIIQSSIRPDEININLNTGQSWNETTCKIIEDRLHDAIEYALAPYWNNQEDENT